MKTKEQFINVIFFPIVTTCRHRFIHRMYLFCADCGISEKKKKKWMERLENDFGCYLAGTIFVERLSPYLLFHELIHHILTLLRGYTQSKIWHNLDYLVDGLDSFLFGK